MHPEVRQGGPGSCPRCGMTLVREVAPAGAVPAATAPAIITAPAAPSPAAAATGEGQTIGTCTMRPEIRQAGPGTCPKCGMNLVVVGPRAEAAPAAPTTARPAAMPAPAMARAHAGHAMPGMSHGAAVAASDGMGDMVGDMHRAMLWPHYVAVMMGFWLIFSPFTLGYLSEISPDPNQLRVMAERGLSPFAHRAMLMTISDIASGLLVVIFGLLSADARRRFPWAQWANAVVGGWLLFAPLFFWTPLPEAYANSTLVGLVVIALAVLIPMMPGMSMDGMMGKPDIPPEWGYGPATFVQRMPIAALALVGFLISRYMAAYQMGHVDGQWEPFFAGTGGLNGTETIITSDMSKAWPVADAGLGTVVYALEIVMTFTGGRDRWRTMPWMVLALALLILPLGIVSIYFIIVQPILIGTWCTLCLVTALAMALMIPFSLDEFVAMGQFLVKSRREGKPFWRTFWTGGAMEGGSDDRSPGPMASAGQVIAQAARGVTLPWTLLASIVIGVWLTFTRASFGTAGWMANSDHLVGLLVVTVAIIALAEVARAARFINVAFGLWLVAAPWLLDGAGSALAQWAGVAAGLLLVALSIP
ncbi:MAG: vitamin K epoxide reductase family protein, partial [Tabrizicola sp.]|nr:vitamin K epoxide reductase family protein [Tabrizicola sp.]